MIGNEGTEVYEHARERRWWLVGNEALAAARSWGFDSNLIRHQNPPPSPEATSFYFRLATITTLGDAGDLRSSYTVSTRSGQ